MTKSEPSNETGQLSAYEVAYLLSPLVAEDQVAATVDRLLKQALQQRGAEIQMEDAPRRLSLAYPLKRVTDNKGTTFREAYLGIIYFKAPSSAVVALETSWSRLPELIRQLVIKRSATTLKHQTKRAASARAPKEAKHEVNQEAIDREIEDLLVK